MLSYAKPYNEIQHEQLKKKKHKKTITIAITQQYLHKRSKGLQPY